MAKRSFSILILCICLISFGAVNAQSIPYRAGEVLVALKPGSNINALVATYGATVKRFLGLNVFLLGTQIGSEELLVTLLSRNLSVNWSELDYLLPVSDVSQYSQAFVDQQSQAFVDQRSQAFVDGNFPPELTQQPSMVQIKATEAQLLASGQDVTVAVVDTGITAHPMFVNKTVPGYDFVDRDSDPSDLPGGAGYSHGAHVAGLVLLTAPKSLIMALRAFANDGKGSVADIYEAMIYAVDRGARLINCSFGLTTRSAALDQATSYASAHGVLVVAAAGNRSQPNLDYPSLQKEALGITGVDSNDVKADFSNWGPQADVSAPAVQLYSSYGDDQLAWWSGTSFAVPLVCGEAALILSIKPTATVNDVVSIIISSPDNIDDLSPMYAKSLGAGRINCLSAVALALR